MGSTVESSTVASTDATTEDDDGETYEVEDVVDRRVVDGQVQYRIRWKTFSPSMDTWEPEEHLEDSCQDLIDAFLKKTETQPEADKSVDEIVLASSSNDEEAIKSAENAKNEQEGEPGPSDETKKRASSENRKTTQLKTDAGKNSSHHHTPKPGYEYIADPRELLRDDARFWHELQFGDKDKALDKGLLYESVKTRRRSAVQPTPTQKRGRPRKSTLSETSDSSRPASNNSRGKRASRGRGRGRGRAQKYAKCDIEEESVHKGQAETDDQKIETEQEIGEKQGEQIDDKHEEADVEEVVEEEMAADKEVNAAKDVQEKATAEKETEEEEEEDDHSEEEIHEEQESEDEQELVPTKKQTRSRQIVESSPEPSSTRRSRRVAVRTQSEPSQSDDTEKSGTDDDSQDDEEQDEGVAATKDVQEESKEDSDGSTDDEPVSLRKKVLPKRTAKQAKIVEPEKTDAATKAPPKPNKGRLHKPREELNASIEDAVDSVVRRVLGDKEKTPSSSNVKESGFPKTGQEKHRVHEVETQSNDEVAEANEAMQEKEKEKETEREAGKIATATRAETSSSDEVPSPAPAGHTELRNQNQVPSYVPMPAAVPQSPVATTAASTPTITNDMTGPVLPDDLYAKRPKSDQNLPIRVNVEIQDLEEMFKEEFRTYRNVQKTVTQEKFVNACFRGDLEVVRPAVQASNNVKNNYTLDVKSSLDDMGNTLLMSIAMRQCDQAHQADDVLEYLHNLGAEINGRNRLGRTALHMAIESKQLCKVNKLLSLRAAVNVLDNKRETPLVLATRLNLGHITSRLLEAGADFNLMTYISHPPQIKEPTQMKPIQVAEVFYNRKCAEVINEHTSRVLGAYESALQAVVTNGGIKIKRRLLEPHIYALFESDLFRVVIPFEPSPLSNHRYGFILAIGLAKFVAQQVQVVMWGTCPVEHVSVNGKTQESLTDEGMFLTTCWPLHKGKNEVMIKCKADCKNSQMKLLVQPLLVQLPRLDLE